MTAGSGDDKGPLFRPLTIGPLTLKNRIAMAPMSRYFCPDEIPHDDMVQYYARRARGGVGLIITEATYIGHPSAHSYENVPRFYGEASLAGWKRVADAVHAEGGKIMPQLWHTGSFREIGMAPDRDVPGFGPSENLNAFENTAHLTKPMTETDIADVIAAYAVAAANAQKLGFDGVELHAAHGYLIDTFFWHETNRRDDPWGGATLAARARFGVEVVKAIRAAVGPDFPLSFRWSQFKQQDYRAKLAQTPQELETLLGPLSDAGVTLFHASTRRFWEPGFKDLSERSLAGWTRDITGKPVVAVGSVGLAGVASTAKTAPGQINSDTVSFADAGLDGVERVEALMEAGEFDIIAVGRALLADPDWADKVRDGRMDERIPFEKALLARLY
jgi:2,4-dienoyl-CoA reductase-like NADH-dependent reductase (Old Yellow Enzyme family)